MGRRLLLCLVLVAACSDDPGPLERLGTAACADLRNGLSFFQIASAGLDSGLSRKEVASAMILGIQDDCPEYQADFEKTAIWREWI